MIARSFDPCRYTLLHGTLDAQPGISGISVQSFSGMSKNSSVSGPRKPRNGRHIRCIYGLHWVKHVPCYQ